MDNLIISGVRIYFPKPGEKLPVPANNMRNFAIKDTTDGRCCLLIFLHENWIVLSLPEYEGSGAAIMAAVRQSKKVWR